MSERVNRTRLLLIPIALLIMYFVIQRVMPARNLPGVVAQSGRTYLIENNSTTYICWKANRVKDRVLVHLDTHDDCRYIDDERITELNQLAGRRKFKTIFERSDIQKLLEFTTSESEFLYDLGNFIYPCLLDGTVNTFYWVVPDKQISPSSKERLIGHFKGVLALDDYPDYEDNGENGFRFTFNDIPVIVTTLDALPQQEPGALLDFDTDFFAFPEAMVDTHIRGEWQWDPEEVCDILEEKVPEPYVTTVCSSVTGGYVPLVYRFVADACFLRLTQGAYPPEAREYMKIVTAARMGEESTSKPPPPSHPLLRASHEYLTACASLIQKDFPKAYLHIDRAAAYQGIYLNGFLEAGRAHLATDNALSARLAAASYEKRIGQETIPSLRLKARAYLREGNVKQANLLSTRALVWDRSHINLTLHAGVFQAMGKEKESLLLYEEALGLAPHEPDCHYNYAVVLAQQGATEPAIQHYETTISLRPYHIAALQNLARLHIENGALDKAEALIQNAHQFKPGDDQTFHIEGLLALKKGNDLEAVETLTRSLEINRHNYAAYSLLADIATKHKQFNRANHYLAQILKHQPSDTSTHASLAHNLEQLKKYELAIKHWNFVLREQPENVEWLVANASCYLAIGKTGPAEILLERAAAAAPNNKDIRERLKTLKARHDGAP